MLKRVKLRGFKSFAGDVTLDLGPGLNVIVGPNGSGKSNFSEAISWALGEQRAGRLRAPGMADVLYQGTASRPGAGLAEVSLQFDDATLETGPAELEVSRRLTRAGESSYHVNRTGCRLLDLQEALSTRGLGTESLAIIRQGQVEELATSRPAQRRAMLDEAAGVGVAKRRRRRAEQKLARVAEKLDRARDLATELASRARALERQARAAERAAALEAEIAGLRETERAARAFAAAAACEAANAVHRDMRERDATARRVLDEARQARTAETDARAEAVGALESAELIAATLRGAADRLAGRVELARERLTELESRQERMGQARADAARRLIEMEAQEKDARIELEAAATALAAAQEAARAAEAAEIELRNAEIEASEAVRRAGSELAASETAVIDADRRAAAAREAMERATYALGQLELTQQDGLGRVERRAEIAERRLTRDRARLDEANAVLEDRSAELRGAEQRQREAAADAQRLVPDARMADHATLADGLSVEAGLERAVAGALGPYADAPVADDVAGAHTLVEGGAGAVVVPAPSRPDGPAPHGARPLGDAIVACPAERRAHVERLLSGVWLVDDLTGVPAGASGVFVDRDGVVFRPADGTVSTSRGAWARHALHQRALEAVEAARAESVRIEELVARATVDRDAARRRVTATERSASRTAERLAGERAAAAARAERLERMRAEVDSAAHAKADAERAGREARLAIDQLAATLETAQAAAESARRHAHEGGAELERRRATLREARSSLAVVDAKTAEIQAQAAAARALVGAADTLPADLALIGRAAAALTATTERLAPLAQDAADRVAGARETFRSAEARLTQAQRDAETAEAMASESRERLHAAEVELRITEERAGEAGPPPDDAPDEPLDPDEVAARLADLERRRLGIGAVNELAATERSELAEREQHIAEQVADLDKSSASLRAHLGELDAAVGEGFEAIFQSVSERFSEVVGLLFPGGTGRLSLVEAEEEDGDEGVEVEVIPGGKRARAMSLMSGGERSLIAMAFCLALAMARPAPFYLLDEVEAALDDTNLRRFLGVVRKLSDETQFIVITHQQPTVEVADTLFGVTMGQDGISQVVSRRLAHSVEGPARPYVRRALRLVNQ